MIIDKEKAENMVKEIPDEIKEKSKEFLNKAVDRLVSSLKGSKRKNFGGCIRLLHSKGVYLVPVEIIGFLKPTAGSKHFAFREMGDCVSSKVVSDGKHMIIEDMDKNSANVRLFKKYVDKLSRIPECKDYANKLKSTKSEIVLPIKVHNKIIGVLNIHCTKKNKFQDKIKQELQDQADIAGTTIENVRLSIA